MELIIFSEFFFFWTLAALWTRCLSEVCPRRGVKSRSTKKMFKNGQKSKIKVGRFSIENKKKKEVRVLSKILALCIQLIIEYPFVKNLPRSCHQKKSHQNIFLSLPKKQKYVLSWFKSREVPDIKIKKSFLIIFRREEPKRHWWCKFVGLENINLEVKRCKLGQV